ncbi:MAG TPA: 4-hydroxy-tetrahydrodipicolinate synthase [Gemmatales bacterium]|nr:4-hydroxy-tetrahydrodipicolinate synthase [Gemmatales bacterium]HMP17505.1 4-hydroxy-tetrahydrodipicolinate synthase [Gemmatales bacterium]
MFHGIIPPVVTPLQSNEDLDLPRFCWFLEHLLTQQVHALFVLGTNSEFYAFDEAEKQSLVATAVAQVRKRVPLVVGTGAESTREVIRLTRMAEKEGADGVSVITPYYVQPSQEELFVHFRRIADSTSLPVMLYNNPGPTGGVKIQPETVQRLVNSCRNIVAIKDSSGDLQNLIDYVRLMPEHVHVFQGRDTIILPSLFCGARGAVAASANVAPQLAVAIYEAFLRGDLKAAQEAQHRLHPIRKSLTLATAPGGPKAALKLLGIDMGPSRGPILPLADSALEKMRVALKEANLL